MQKRSEEIGPLFKVMQLANYWVRLETLLSDPRLTLSLQSVHSETDGEMGRRSLRGPTMENQI